MCGIVAYIGERDATPIVVNGLKKLEYRGYDSAGVAVLQDGKSRFGGMPAKSSIWKPSSKASHCMAV